MNHDLRDDSLSVEAQALWAALVQPGSGRLCDAAEPNISPDLKHIVFTGTVFETFEGVPPTRLCLTDLTSGTTQLITHGPHCDHMPRHSPDGKSIAFLSDRYAAGDFQLYLYDVATGAVSAAPHVSGWVEYFHWSPDGTRILLGVAGHGADIASGEGAVPSKYRGEAQPDWTPEIESGDESFRFRHVWVFEVQTCTIRCVELSMTNVWEASWCGPQAIVAVTSAGSNEGSWYSAWLHRIDLASSALELLFQPGDQLGWPAASPSGDKIAFVEAVCSDRGIVAGELRMIDTARAVRCIDTNGVDISCVEWRAETLLLLAGHRALETVVGIYDVSTDQFRELWCSEEISTGGHCVKVTGCGDAGDCVLIGEGFTRAPELAMIERGTYRAIRSFGCSSVRQVTVIATVSRIHWTAPDGLEIQGWLLEPVTDAPYPLITVIHGGPIASWRPHWLGRRHVYILMLLARGFAIFLPNPRGSSGHGLSFARRVIGDMGGADAQDCLSGIDHLVAQGLADPKRLGLTGRSYGGFMTCWLITQDARFAAAVSVAPMTNFVTQHLISNIPDFVKLFVADPIGDPTGQYFKRSPIHHAHKTRTPTLNICGALDRCTPAAEARQFHSALLAAGITSVLVTYPKEGHGVRTFPAAFDFAARLVGWFETHIAAKDGQNDQ